jgi:hypothetical protein
VNASNAVQSTYSGLFFQDDWKITRRLTINMGLRYEYETPLTERFNRTVGSFDFSTANPVEAQVRANYAASPIPEIAAANFRVTGGLLYAGAGSQPRSTWRGDRNNFAPRLGLAFQLTPKTVIRTGYGIFFDVTGSDRFNVNQSGFSQASNIIPSLDNGQTFVGTFANPFPTGIQTPPGNSLGLRTFLGRSGDHFFPQRPNPYMQRWSFTIQSRHQARCRPSAQRHPHSVSVHQPRSRPGPHQLCHGQCPQSVLRSTRSGRYRSGQPECGQVAAIASLSSIQ